MDEPNLDALLTTPEAARMLRLSARTLERRRFAGAEPRYVALGRAIRYRRSDLIDWIERSRSEQ
jgi:predicted DNA-binding transcriptional regulator AlpA